MDPFMSACLGIGLALAAGAILGALSGLTRLHAVLLALAAIAGAAVFFLALNGNDHAAWPGIPAGAAVGALAYVVGAGIVVGALERSRATAEEHGSPAAISGTVAIAALAVAALATLLPPVALIFLAAFAWMGLARRRRAQQKYEGLRVLR